MASSPWLGTVHSLFMFAMGHETPHPARQLHSEVASLRWQTERETGEPAHVWEAGDHGRLQRSATLSRLMLRPPEFWSIQGTRSNMQACLDSHVLGFWRCNNHESCSPTPHPGWGEKRTAEKRTAVCFSARAQAGWGFRPAVLQT